MRVRVKDKSSSEFVNWMSILQAKEELEQKKYLLYMEKNNEWKIRDKLLTVEAKLLVVGDILPQSDVLLATYHNTSYDILLELVLANMRDATKNFYINLQREKNKKMDLLKKLNEFSS